jgi:hypothetical protein
MCLKEVCTSIAMVAKSFKYQVLGFGLALWCLTPLSTIFLLYRDGSVLLEGKT